MTDPGRLAATLLVAVLALLAVPSPGAGQLVVSAGAGWYDLDVDQLPEPDAGLGLDAALGWAATDWLELRAGAQVQRHAVGASSDPYEVVVPFVEARLRAPLGRGPWSAFVAPRAGWIRHSLTVLGRDVSGTGSVAGVIAGVAFGLTPSVAVELAAVYYRGTVDDVEVDGDPFDLEIEDLAADVKGLRIALSWRPR